MELKPRFKCRFRKCPKQADPHLYIDQFRLFLFQNNVLKAVADAVIRALVRIATDSRHGEHAPIILAFRRLR